MRMTVDAKASLELESACVVPCFNLELVEEIREAMPSATSLAETADFYGALADPTRLRILLALARGELCVCDVSHVIGLSVSATSHQLRLLRDRGIVRSRSDGKMAYYSLSDTPALACIRERVASRSVQEAS